MQDDQIIKRALKRWAARHRTPLEGRRRLIAAAARPLSPHSSNLTWSDGQVHYRPTDQFYMTFTWSIINTLQSGQLGLRLCI